VRRKLASKWALYEGVGMRWNCLADSYRSLNARFPLLNFSIYLDFSRHFIQGNDDGGTSSPWRHNMVVLEVLAEYSGAK
jgi:hypothetical protein